jgi:D-allose transport system substrate-binding protein
MRQEAQKISSFIRINGLSVHNNCTYIKMRRRIWRLEMKKLLAITIVAVMSLAMVGCGGQSNGGGSASDADEVRFALLLKPLANEYWATMAEGVEAWAEENNVIVNVYGAESEENLVGQLSQLEDIINREYDGIALAPLSPVNLISGILLANERGIPVINVDEPVAFDELRDSGGSMIANVTTDNVNVGRQGGQFIVDTIGSGEVAIIEGTGGNVTSQNRAQGAREIFEATPGIELVASQPADWDRVMALDVATNIIQANPDLRAFYAANDTMALGIFQAVQNAGLTDQIIVVGTDAVPGAVESVANGEMAATVGQDPVGIGIRCIELLIEAVNDGWTPDPAADIPILYVDSFLVTIDNAE